MCPKYVKCPTCGRNQGKIHVCEGRLCLNCSKSVNMEQKCFILTQEERDKSKKRTVDGEIKNQTKGYIFLDYESMNVDGLHKPNLIIADKMCFYCIDRWKVNEVRETCESNCGILNFNYNDEFCYWLLEQKNYSGFAHNLKAYDGIFNMKYIVDGDKFMSVKDRNDFLNWHAKQNGIFNFNEEMYKYCLSDVEI